MGQAILEEVPVQARHRAWIDLVSQMFGGLALCSLEALVTRDGTEVIIEVNDSAMGLLGESQEEDRRRIAEVVLAAMETANVMAKKNQFNFKELFRTCYMKPLMISMGLMFAQQFSGINAVMFYSVSIFQVL